jgi:hypothetical protein
MIIIKASINLQKSSEKLKNQIYFCCLLLFEKLNKSTKKSLTKNVKFAKTDQDGNEISFSLI